ncbi:MOS1T transposase, partial [Pseudoatta argentina]
MSIQSPAKCEIRSVIRYLVWKGKTPVEVYNEVKTAYGDTGMNRTSGFKWCREFKNGRTSVHDDQRSGRPSILTDDIVKKIENALRDDRRLTVDELSAMFPQISRSLLHETITETLGYRKLSARWVPKQLTDQHKLNRVEAGQEFLRRYKLHGDEFLRSIVTGDETWVEKILKMSIFVPNKVYLRGILLHYFIQKKSAAEAHRILVQTYDDNALSDTTCRDWFRRFKNNDFELEDKERSGAPKKFQDKELEQLLDEDPSQTLPELGKILQVDESTVSKRLKGLGMIQKQGHWVPYELLLLLYLQGILLHYFIQKKSAAEAHRILVQTYDDNALSDTTCTDWFRRFKNNDFELEDKERSGAPKKCQDKELKQLLDEDPSQTLPELGKILQVDESTV